MTTIRLGIVCYVQIAFLTINRLIDGLKNHMKSQSVLCQNCYPHNLQVEWLKSHSKSYTDARRILRALQVIRNEIRL
jgi:hypothetical protein